MWSQKISLGFKELAVSGSFLPEAALHFVVISNFVVILTSLHGAVTNPSFPFQILFSPEFV